MSSFKLILILSSLQAAYQHEHAGVFPSKMCSERRKNHGCGQKKPKSTIFGVETAAKSCELKRCADRVRTDEVNLNFWPELYRLIFFA